MTNSNICNKCGKEMSSRQSLWNHKQRCADKSPLEVKEDYFQPESVHDVVQKSKKRKLVTNSKMQAFADEIINSNSKTKILPNLATPQANDKNVKESTKTFPSPTPSSMKDIITPLKRRASKKRANFIDEDSSPKKMSLSPSPSVLDDMNISDDEKSSSCEDDSSNNNTDDVSSSNNTDDDTSSMETDDDEDDSSSNNTDDDSIDDTLSIIDDVKYPEKLVDKSSNDEKSEDLSNDAVEKMRRMSVDELTDSFIELYKKFECDGSKEYKSTLLSMLNELIRQNGISKEHYSLLKKRIGKIYKNPTVIPLVKCATNEIIQSDVTELNEILSEIKKEVDDDDEKIEELERLLGAGDFIDGKSTLPILLKAIDNLEGLIPKSKIHRMRVVVNDIDKNKHRIVIIFNRLQNAKDKQDEQHILKQLASEELLSPEQYNQLSELEEINPHSIAITIKGTKIGKGLMHLPTKIDSLRGELVKYLADYSGHAPVPRRLCEIIR